MEVCSAKEITDLRFDLKPTHSPWHKLYSAFVFLIENDITESKSG